MHISHVEHSSSSIVAVHGLPGAAGVEDATGVLACGSVSSREPERGGLRQSKPGGAHRHPPIEATAG